MCHSSTKTNVRFRATFQLLDLLQVSKTCCAMLQPQQPTTSLSFEVGNSAILRSIGAHWRCCRKCCRTAIRRRCTRRRDAVHGYTLQLTARSSVDITWQVTGPSASRLLVTSQPLLLLAVLLLLLPSLPPQPPPSSLAAGWRRRGKSLEQHGHRA